MKRIGLKESVIKKLEGEIPATSQNIDLNKIRETIKEIWNSTLKSIQNSDEKYCVIKQVNDLDGVIKNVHIKSIDNPLKLTLKTIKSADNNFQRDIYSGDIISMRRANPFEIHTRGSKNTEEFNEFKESLKNMLEICKNDSYNELKDTIIKHKGNLTQNDLNRIIISLKRQARSSFNGFNLNIDANIIQKEDINNNQESLF